jgi:hypothetical protein
MVLGNESVSELKFEEKFEKFIQNKRAESEYRSLSASEDDVFVTDDSIPSNQNVSILVLRRINKSIS